MQCTPLKVVICGRWKHCSKVIHWPGVYYCTVLSVVRKISEVKVHISVEQRVIIKFLMKEGCKPSEICSRLKRQYGEKTLSDVSVYKWSSAFKQGRETVKNEPHERRLRTSKTGKNSDCLDALIRENRRITVRELSGILNISDGSVKTIIKQHLQYLKVCTRWIPYLLTDKHKYTAASGAILLSWDKQEGDFFWILSWQPTRRGRVTSCPKANVLQCSGVGRSFAIMRKWYRMFRSGCTGNQKTSSWAASASFRTAGPSVSQTREIMLRSNSFSFGE